MRTGSTPPCTSSLFHGSSALKLWAKKNLPGVLMHRLMLKGCLGIPLHPSQIRRKRAPVIVHHMSFVGVVQVRRGPHGLGHLPRVASGRTGH